MGLAGEDPASVRLVDRRPCLVPVLKEQMREMLALMSQCYSCLIS